MTAATDVLAKHGVTISDQELADELSQSLEDAPYAVATAPLTESEIDYLAAHAGGDAADILANMDPTRTHRRQTVAKARATAKALRGLLTRADTADMLGIDPSGVSRRIKQGKLWALPKPGRRIPAWQISAGDILPGLRAVVSAIPSGAHPLASKDL